MSTNTQIVIQDTCILLDLLALNLLEVFFQLGYIVYTTPQITSEIMNETQWTNVEAHINNGDLKIDGEGSIEAISLILAENIGLSFADASIYELGMRKEGIILSSDRSLRKCCEKSGLEVHGMLWIIQSLHITGKVDRDSACAYLRQYSYINTRVPKVEIANLIKEILTYSI